MSRKTASLTAQRRRANGLRAALALILVAGSALAGLPELGRRGDAPWLEALGREAMAQTLRQQRALIDAESHAYIDELLLGLGAANGMSAVPLQLRLFADPAVNAFALPGGYIGVYAGLVLVAPDEGALVSVLAHELAHLRQRHIDRILERQQQASLTSVAAMVAALAVARQSADAAQAAIYSGMATAQSQMLAYSREHETEADRSGQRLMQNAGFDPAGMARMFQAMAATEQLNRSGGLEYLQTHPMTRARIAAASRFVGRPAPGDLPRTDTTFVLMQARIAALVGAARNGPAAPYGRALARLVGGDVAGAREALAGLDERFAHHRSVRLLSARIALADAEPERALADLEAIAVSHPNWLPAQLALAEALRDAGRADEGAAHFSRHLRLHPPRWPGALMAAARLAESAHDQSGALFWRAEHQLQRGDRAAAASLFLRALDMLPEDSAAAARLQARLDQLEREALEGPNTPGR